MEASCIATVKRHNLSIHQRKLCSLLLRALPELLGLPPTLLKKFSKEEQVHPPLLETTRGTLLELPQDILMDIFTFLEIPDLVRAGSVCSSWYSAYTSLCNLGQYKQSQTPCLLYTSETDSENVARLYSLVEKKSYNLILPEPPIRSRYIIGSSNGWLVTSDARSEMHLLNPITGEQFALPSVITMEQVTPLFDGTGAVCKYSFAENPNVYPPRTLDLHELREHLHLKAFVFYDTSAKGYIVVLIHNPYELLSFAWVGDDKWTCLPHDNFRDCVYKDGLLYAVAVLGKIFAFNLRGPMVTVKLMMGIAQPYLCDCIYIVQAPCGDLLQVWWERDGNEYDADSATYVSYTDNFSIFKADTAAEKHVQINSLDDLVLVLGPSRSLCLSAEEYPQLKANHVYFTEDKENIYGYKDKCCDIVVFDIANNRREELVSTQLWSNWPAPIWITPALAKLCPTVKNELCLTPVSSLSSCNRACLRAAYIFFCIICAYLIGWGTIL